MVHRLFFFFILISPALSAQNVALTEVRSLYQASSSCETSCGKLEKLLVPYNEVNNPTLAGYKACATMMKAQYAFNPISKLDYFSNGKNLLERCIENEKENIELRYLRFTVQCNAPSFLGYKKSIEEDKSKLLKSIERLEDAQLKSLIIAYLLESEFVDSEEKARLKY